MALSPTAWDTIISQLEQRIISVTLSNNPDYSIAGRSFSKASYLSQLMAAVEKARDLRQDADGAFQVDSRGIT